MMRNGNLSTDAGILKKPDQTELSLFHRCMRFISHSPSGADLSVETLRGIAIILVIAYHLTGDAPLGQQRGFYEQFSFFFQNIRMPLFTVISGYLYGLRPVVGGSYFLFLRGKTRRLLLPLFVVSSLQFIASVYVPGVNNPESLSDLYKIYIFPYEHYWFLQSIFVVFVIAGVFSLIGCLYKFSTWLMVMVLAFALSFVTSKHFKFPDFFSLNGAFYLLPYFLLGYGISNFKTKVLRKSIFPLWVALLIAAFIAQYASYFLDFGWGLSKRSIIGMLVGVSSCCIVFYVRKPVPVLSMVGSYAFSIYLYQAFGTAIGRKASLYLGLEGHAYFVFVLCAGIMFGIATEEFIRRIPVARTLLLGAR